MRYIAYWGGRNHIVFMGDSRIRQLYYAFIKLVSTKEVSSSSSEAPPHHNLSFQEHDLNLDVQFLWYPVLDEAFFRQYESWLQGDAVKRPKMVVTGCGTWSIKSSNASVRSLESYKTNITRLLKLMDSMGNSGSQILWALQDPVLPEKLSKDRRMISNEQIDLYNKAALDALRYSTSDGVHVWSSSRLVSQGFNDDSLDGLHMGDVALGYAIEILLNMYCNDQMNYNDGTCCADPEPITIIQIITFSVFCVFISTSLAMFFHRTFCKKREHRWTLLVNENEEDVNSNSMNEIPLSSDLSPTPNVTIVQVPPTSYYDLVVCVGKFGLIMFYVYICDRTNFFMKENKYYTHPNFFLPIAYVFALGLFFTENSSHVKVMHRDQTEEWKGWMQLVILTYHMTGASQVLPIYVMIRLLVTTYLFLTGFGHFTYFWNTPDHGIHRLWQVCSVLSFSSCIS